MAKLLHDRAAMNVQHPNKTPNQPHLESVPIAAATRGRQSCIGRLYENRINLNDHRPRTMGRLDLVRRIYDVER